MPEFLAAITSDLLRNTAAMTVNMKRTANAKGYVAKPSQCSRA